MKEQYPREETLYMLLVEIEGIINGHPLTHVSLDHCDDEALTLCHFLLGSSSVAAPPGRFTITDTNMCKSWRASQALADQFWQRWVQEYLPDLIRHSKWNMRTTPPAVDDIAIIVDRGPPRNRWTKGRIVTVFPGKDGIVQVVDIKTAIGTFRRAVSILCILDVVEN